MTLFSLGSLRPHLGRGVFVAPGAAVIGDVALCEDSSVWFGCTLRGDVGPIRIGARSNVQDGTIVHMTGGLSEIDVGADVTVGHGCILHGCSLGDRVLVGMGTIVLDGAAVEPDVILGAGSLLVPRQRVPSGFLYVGRPAKPVRPLREDELARIRESAAHYVDNARRYAQGLQPVEAGESAAVQDDGDGAS